MLKRELQTGRWHARLVFLRLNNEAIERILWRNDE